MGTTDWWLVTGDLNTTFGHRQYLYSAALPYFYAPHHHFAFLISNFSFMRGFHPQSMGTPPTS